MPRIEPYLFFDGRAEEAVSFYERVLGAKVEVKLRYSDAPEVVPPERMPARGSESILHASLQLGDTRLLLSDGRQPEGTSFRGFCLSLHFVNEAEARQVFEALAEGGQVTMPLDKTFFSPCFGMLVDRFDVPWMVIVEASAKGAG